VYDITSWISKHPGGDLIRQGAGTECTAIFESSHPPYVNESYLSKYKIGELIPEERDQRYNYHGEFWTVLKKRVWGHFKTNNIDRHDCVEYYLKSLLLFSLFAMFYVMGLYYGTYKLTLVAAIIGPLCAICIMHDGQHGAASKHPFVNHATGWLIDFFGSSGLVWKHEHNLGHHQYTNTETDPDATSGAPFVRLSPLAPHEWYHKYQHLYIWVMYSVIMIRWYFVDYYHYFTGDFNGTKLYPASKVENVLFWLGKLTYITYTFLLPAYLYGVGWGVIYYLTFAVAASYSFAFQFTVNHLTPDVHWPTNAPDQEKDWAKMQILTSSNYAVDSSLAAFFSGGLNFQIEHHLFPTFCHVHYKSRIAPIVQQTCKEFDVPYNAIPSYWEAISGHYYQLRALGNPKTIS